MMGIMPDDPRQGPRTPGTSDLADPLVGATLVGRYQILRRIGEGGMGAVYEGRHLVLGKQVAIKVLLERLLERPELVARLLQEARLASSIGHENIVAVTDFGTTDDGRSFVVMEFLEGESLAALVAREAPLPVARCLHLGRQIASALAAAHDKGIVHRDVKPENAFVLRRGEQDFVKVMDFGVSKAVQGREEGPELLRLTRTGMVLGTPLYMSPEQAAGDEDVDGRADVWALGVVLYECLTGEVPFRARNYLGVISQVLTGHVEPPSRLRPELAIPPAVEAVVMRAMQKDRGRRYQRMADLEADLGKLIAGDPNVGVAGAPASSSAPPVLSAQRPRWHLLAAGALLVAVGVAAALRRDEGPPTATATTDAVEQLPKGATTVVNRGVAQTTIQPQPTPRTVTAPTAAPPVTAVTPMPPSSPQSPSSTQTSGVGTSRPEPLGPAPGPLRGSTTASRPEPERPRRAAHAGAPAFGAKAPALAEPSGEAAATTAKEKPSLDKLGTLDDFKNEDRRKATAP